MKHLRIYENFSKWINITEKDGVILLNIYGLANEMLDSINEEPDKRTQEEIDEIEKKYASLVRQLLINKVITLYTIDLDKHKGICDDVSFEGEYITPEKGYFGFGNVFISLEDADLYLIPDEDVIIHLNEDPEMYRAINKYNI